MQTVHALDPLRNAVAGLRAAGPVALVPTMGALHDGHLTLVREARRHAASVVVSIFVNPLQFGANEDLDAYPRQMERDSRLLEAEGVDLLWAPTAQAMYPPGFASTISVTGVSEGLCGTARPGHFDGVATVVCKLFNQVMPDVALFGEKDWQQLSVIRRMARDLDLTRPAANAILGVPTVREADGLAMSSRNAYLTPQQRAKAVALPTAMRRAIAQIEAGADVPSSLARLKSDVLEGGFGSLDYAELREADDLGELHAVITKPMRLLVAARIGTTRLIDNMAVKPAQAPEAA
ncbi:pantoate--beta-alanine ligase [Novosphingobium sp. Leaf2]|uniref:pantoate--beta-alanine ligase n=1 Tax=Novosphingobium sp. Leaf2 TaxID=1735670 RepID=UPI0006F1FAEB|nr:pantoate--beta-alanine ligase [Novosphingobium sp. Leaf2]KQM20285.1 pantoate--beta-alanine ligase [Novosphingobium sp. Leaf2]